MSMYSCNVKARNISAKSDRDSIWCNSFEDRFNLYTEMYPYTRMVLMIFEDKSNSIIGPSIGHLTVTLNEDIPENLADKYDISFSQDVVSKL